MARPAPTNPAPVDFGPNVHIFDPSMTDIQAKTDAIYHQQDGDANQFGPGRHAYLFKPGTYNNINIQMAYYITVHGLGKSPDDVVINGTVQALGKSTGGMALNNFWRGAENFSVIPPASVGSINPWAVSQATYLRRFHIRGQLFLFDYLTPGPNNFSSGGFMADGVVDGQVIPGSQQQFLTRNTNVTKWRGGVWNMVFVGSQGDIRLGDDIPTTATWPDVPITLVDKTPRIREKPYLIIDQNGHYAVQVPCLKDNSQGTSWSGTPDRVNTIPIHQFYIAKAATDTADTINAALKYGHHLILTPGVYHLSTSLEVTCPDTVVLGMGMATLTPDNGTPAIIIADVGGVSVSGLLLDAGPKKSPSLLIAGPHTSHVDHCSNPVVIHDVSCRVGGAIVSSSDCCFTINSDNVILDNIWLWRADHGNTGTVGWTVNPADHGIIVNGRDVTAYGLFVEHFEKFQTVWNGNGGAVYFYQSEIPYDVPSQNLWQQNGEKGYPSYKVSPQVESHHAEGVGIYCYFLTPNVQLENAIETPTSPKIQMKHLVTIWLDGQPGTSINHIINGTGAAVTDREHMKATSLN